MHLQYLLLGKIVYQDMLSAMQSVMDQDHRTYLEMNMIIFLTSSTVATVKEASR